MIDFTNVTRRFGSKTAVDDLSLSVRSGEVFALLGPNGAGKTTAIKMLVGLLRPNSGTVSVFGNDLVRQTRQAVAHIGYIPDQPFLYDKLSGREFLDFVGDMRGLDRDTRRQRIARECDNFDLGEFIDNLTETYSHGMKQRLVFASALLHDPAALVIDEPMVGLDPRSMRLVKDLLQQRAGEGAVVLMSTHTLAVAEEIADRIGIVDHGHLHFNGTIEQLRDKFPARHNSLESLFLEMTNGNNHR
ncbi:MAG: ABC transporter ATP-binding protein [Thermoguttaceae bacterium]